MRGFLDITNQDFMKGNFINRLKMTVLAIFHRFVNPISSLRHVHNRRKSSQNRQTCGHFDPSGRIYGGGGENIFLQIFNQKSKDGKNQTSSVKKHMYCPCINTQNCVDELHLSDYRCIWCSAPLRVTCVPASSDAEWGHDPKGQHSNHLVRDHFHFPQLHERCTVPTYFET